jgi:hypothetical protein
MIRWSNVATGNAVKKPTAPVQQGVRTKYSAEQHIEAVRLMNAGVSSADIAHIMKLPASIAYAWRWNWRQDVKRNSPDQQARSAVAEPAVTQPTARSASS